MNRNKRPLSVTVLAAVYLAVGSVGFVYHLSQMQARDMLHYDGILIEVVELIAIFCGVFLLRGQNWARWATLAWIAFHVILSAFHAAGEFAVHALFCAVIAWVLFRPEAARYFRRAVV